MKEALVLQSIRLALSNGDTRLFRNNVGDAWQGEATVLPDGSVLIRNPQRVRYGLAKGSHDLIGWHREVVTPAMVGARVARFLSIEVKSSTGRVSPEQERWLENVRAAGGLAVIARSVEDAEELVGRRPAGA